MEALFVSTLVVAVAEIGDKTQLLALVLAARFRRPVPIVLGILAATVANHAAAGVLGAWLGTLLAPETLRWVLGVSFLATAVWALIPDKLDADEAQPPSGYGVFAATLIAFFLAEIGDKTQIATVALAARFDALVPVVVGTTLGMLAANVPAVLAGTAAGKRFDLPWMRFVAAGLFTALGVLALAGTGLDGLLAQAG